MLASFQMYEMLNMVEELVYFIGASPLQPECYLSSTEDKQ